MARRFFEERRPLGQHLDWLRFQVAREARNLEEIASHQRCELVEQVDRSVSRETLVDQLTEDYQEVPHYGMLAYIYEGISGERVQWRELRETAQQASWYEMSRREHRRWAELKAGGSELELAAALFTRGGGGSLFYGMIPLQARLRGGPLSRLEDHSQGRDRARRVGGKGRPVPLIRGRDDVETASRIIAGWAPYGWEMRNAQYGKPMPEERLREIPRAISRRDHGRDAGACPGTAKTGRVVSRKAEAALGGVDFVSATRVANDEFPLL